MVALISEGVGDNQAHERDTAGNLFRIRINRDIKTKVKCVNKQTNKHENP